MVIDDLVQNQPIRRTIGTQEQANAVMWLCPEEAGMVTGHVLHVDGGWTARSGTTAGPTPSHAGLPRLSLGRVGAPLSFTHAQAMDHQRTATRRGGTEGGRADKTRGEEE